MSNPKRSFHRFLHLPIEQLTGAFEPEKYEDTYRDALLAIIKAKQKGAALR